MKETDEKIIETATALADALTAAGGDFQVTVSAVDVTRMHDTTRRYAYRVRIVEHNDRELMW